MCSLNELFSSIRKWVKSKAGRNKTLYPLGKRVRELNGVASVCSLVPSFLYQKYVAEGLNPAQIAAQTFSCRATVMARLRAFGIPPRHEAEGYKTRSQLGFGEAIRRGRVVAHQREQAAIRKMQKLRERNWSYWKIAEVMNDWGVKTKTGKGKWHARPVQQILDRISK